MPDIKSITEDERKEAEKLSPTIRVNGDHPNEVLTLTIPVGALADDDLGSSIITGILFGRFHNDAQLILLNIRERRSKTAGLIKPKPGDFAKKPNLGLH